VLTWLLQVVTGLAAAAAWGAVAARIPEETPFAAPVDAEAPPPIDDVQDETDDEPFQLAPLPPQPAPVAPVAEPEEPPPAPEPVAVPPAGPTERAHAIFQERLAYSPRRREAQALVDEITRAARAGRTDEAHALVERLSEL
jgi:hypothetical protein